MNVTEHLLVCLNEELLEVAKNVDKALRFGIDDRNILDPEGPTNRERMILELNDIMGVVEMLVEKGVFPEDWRDAELSKVKKVRVTRFMEYARQHGTLDVPGDYFDAKSRT